jgi:hypothetical protein
MWFFKRFATGTPGFANEKRVLANWLLHEVFLRAAKYDVGFSVRYPDEGAYRILFWFQPIRVD